MKIHVRRRHIKKGKRSHARLCPVALAFKERAHKRRVHVSQWYLESGAKIFDLPQSVQEFIARFDAGKPVKPFAFVLK